MVDPTIIKKCQVIAIKAFDAIQEIHYGHDDLREDKKGNVLIFEISQI